MASHNVALSKAFSKILRHKAPSMGLEVDERGYVRLADLFKCQQIRRLHPTVAAVEALVADNDKQRFSLEKRPVGGSANSGAGSESDNDNDEGSNGSEKAREMEYYICANQGHSFELKAPPLEPITAEDAADDRLAMVIHGTYRKAWDAIRESGGLSKMNRTHIHFAAGMPGQNGVISGMRKSCNTLIFINLPLAIQDGFKFFQSKNGVILCAGDDNGMLPLKYFADVQDRKTRQTLDSFKAEE